MRRQALAALRSAMEAGWTDVRHTGRDADLAAPRDRDDFSAVLAGLLDRSFPPDPFAR